ncbi:MAG: type II secretion system protein [Acidobacteriota bacterium]
MSRSPGFSLLELMVVMAIVSLVASVAIPSLILSRLSANESAAADACRMISEAEAAFAKGHGGQYADLEALLRAGLLGGGLARGYSFSAGDVAGSDTDGAPPESYGFIATPSAGHGRHVFAVGPDGTVRYQQAAPGFSLPPGIRPGEPVGNAGGSRE